MNKVQQIFKDHIHTAEVSATALDAGINQASKAVVEALQRGNKVLIFGNGGSAADAQHIAAELVGRFVKQRRSLPAIALTTDTSALTAIANDYGYDHVFERQVEGLANAGDVLIGLSTSGNSPNVLNAIKIGRQLGCTTIALLGNTGGIIKDVCDISLTVPSNVTARIQEVHILIGHIICDFIDEAF